MKEAPFQGWVLDVAARFGWRAWHCPYPVRPIGGGKFVPEPCAAGLPDLVLIHDDPPSLIFAELKGTGGTLTPAQRGFLALAVAVAERTIDVESITGRQPVGAYVWKPGDEQQIETILRSRVLA